MEPEPLRANRLPSDAGVTSPGHPQDTRVMRRTCARMNITFSGFFGCHCLFAFNTSNEVLRVGHSQCFLKLDV